MSKKESFWEHPIAKIEEVLSIKRQIAELQSRLSSLFTGKSSRPSKGGKGKRSLAVRKKMAAAQKARWARRATEGGKPVTKSVTKPAVKKGKRGGKRNLSPETRARLSAFAKARWAASRKT